MAKFTASLTILLTGIFLQPVSGQKGFAVFSDDRLMEVAIRFDLSAYLRKAIGDGSLGGTITFNYGSGDSLTRNCNIKTRGQFRLKNCSFAPMEINLKKSVHAYPDSSRFKKLKLVTHCQPGTKYDEYVLREYLVYKLFNAITDTSFRVRLLRITYIDTEKKRKPLIQYGFFIEPKAVLAARTNSSVVESMNLNQNHLRQRSIDRVAIFSYMAGSWDWAVQSLHNIEVLKPLAYDGSDRAIAVPFDFDLTGIVDPDYLLPPLEKGIASNRDRVYMGLCRDRDTYRRELQEFVANKGSLYEVIENFPYLSERAKHDITNYLDSFFDNLDKPKSTDIMINHFISTCKKN